MLFAAMFERAFATAIEEGTTAAMPKNPIALRAVPNLRYARPLTEIFPSCCPRRFTCYTFNPSSAGNSAVWGRTCVGNRFGLRGRLSVSFGCFHQLEGDLSQSGISGK